MEVKILHICVILVISWEDFIQASVLNVPNGMQETFRSSIDSTFLHPKVYRCNEASLGNELVVNFVNRNYPRKDITDQDCSFSYLITNPNVCQIRVDFVDAEFLSPTRGECLSQYFIVEGPVWPTGLPPLCGKNFEQHLYVHLVQPSYNISVVEFNVKTVIRGRAFKFGIWLTQIDCRPPNLLKAPEGCTQWFLQDRGVIKSYNFEGSRYLSNENYKVCVRPSKGICGIKFEALKDDFNLRKSSGTRRNLERAGVGAKECKENYILIPGSRGSIRKLRNGRLLFKENKKKRKKVKNVKPTAVQSSWDRYCGGRFSPRSGDQTNQPVYAHVRSNLISVAVKTSPLQETRGVGDILNLTSGFRLTYRQLKDCEDVAQDLASPFRHSTIFQTWNFNKYLPPFMKHPFKGGNKESASNDFISSVQSGSGYLINSTYPEATDEDEIWDYLDYNAHIEDYDEYDMKELYDFLN